MNLKLTITALFSLLLTVISCSDRADDSQPVINPTNGTTKLFFTSVKNKYDEGANYKAIANSVTADYIADAGDGKKFTKIKFNISVKYFYPEATTAWNFPSVTGEVTKTLENPAQVIDFNEKAFSLPLNFTIADGIPYNYTVQAKEAVLKITMTDNTGATTTKEIDNVSLINSGVNLVIQN